MVKSTLSNPGRGLPLEVGFLNSHEEGPHHQFCYMETFVETKSWAVLTAHA